MQPSCTLCLSKDINLTFFSGIVRLFRCKTCGMIFRADTPPIDFRWEDDFAFNNKPNTILIKNKIAYEKMENIIKFAIKKPDKLKILEVGSGDGSLAYLFINKGSIYSGIEPSEYLFNKSLRTHPILNGKIQNCSLENALLPHKFFNFLILIDVLEHINNPLDFLKNIQPFLTKDSAIYIEIPDETYFKIMVIIRRFFGLYNGYPGHPQHVNFFTPKTASILIKNAGFRLKSITRTSSFSDPNMLSLLSNGKYYGMIKYFCKFINKINHLYNRMTIQCETF